MAEITKDDIANELRRMLGVNIKFEKLSKEELITLYSLFEGNNLLTLGKRLLTDRLERRITSIVDALSNNQGRLLKSLINRK